MERPAPEHQNECCVLVVCATAEEPDEDDERSELTRIPDKSNSPSASTSGTGNRNIRFLQITSTTMQLQFPGITGGNLMYVEDKLFNLRDVPWENTIILKGNKIFTLRDLKPGTKYKLRWQTPDVQFPDVEVSTQPLSSSSKKTPKVIVTEKTFNSFTLSFDHFAPEDYNNGYVALFKRANESQWQTEKGKEKKNKQSKTFKK